MLKKTITYDGFEGETITRDFYFNMTRAELIKLELSDETEGMDARIRRIQSDDASGKEILQAFEDILKIAYGSRIGNDFVKSPAGFDIFSATEAYSELLFELTSDAKKAAEFVSAIMPTKLLEQTKKAAEMQKNIFEQNEYNVRNLNAERTEAGLVENPTEMTDEELLKNLGAEEPEVRTTNGLTDVEIQAMPARDLTKQPREVLIRAYQLKNQK